MLYVFLLCLRECTGDTENDSLVLCMCVDVCADAKTRRKLEKSVHSLYHPPPAVCFLPCVLCVCLVGAVMAQKKAAVVNMLSVLLCVCMKERKHSVLVEERMERI